MKNSNITQGIIIGVSIVAIVIAVVMFSTFRGNSKNSSLGNTIVWGIVSEDVFEEALRDLGNEGFDIQNIKYVQKKYEDFQNQLLKAVAGGTQPDLVLIENSQILENKDRLQYIPFKTTPLREYQDLFIEESNILVSKDGIIGYPFLLDPIVLYYNKDLLYNAGYSKPPQTWTEVLAIAPLLTQKDTSFNISKSTIALGSFDNITNAKDIFWMLVLQAGNPVIKRTVEDQTQKEIYISILNENLNFTLNPAYAATNFFTQFSNPTKTIYSWNRSLPESQTSFISGDLVFYLGKASELPVIKKINPNLNFDVTMVPQSQSSSKKVTYGTMYTLAIPKGAKNIKGATSVIGMLTSNTSQNIFVKKMSMASVRRDTLVSSEESNTYQSIFNKSAIIAQGILEPNSKNINDIIKELIDTIVSGQYEVSEAITRAHDKISLILHEE